MCALVLLALLADVQGGSTAPAGKGIYPIVIHRDQSFNDRVNAVKFEYVDPSVTAERFGQSGTGTETVDVVMVNFDYWAPLTKEVLPALKKRGLRPATADELIAFVTRYPNFPREFPIVALGSVWRPADNVGRVLIVEPHMGSIALDIEYLNGEWDSRARFLAVRGK